MRSDPRPMMSTRRRLLGAAALAGLATPWRLRAAPADSPRLDEADFVLNSLTTLAVSKAPDGVVTVSLKM